MTAPAGACTVVLGPNGSGKSTLLAAICGDLPLTAGSIRLNGTSTHGLPAADAARQRAVMTQAVGVAFGFTTREVVAMGRAPWRGLRQSMADEQIIDQAMVTADVTQLARTFRPCPAAGGAGGMGPGVGAGHPEILHLGRTGGRTGPATSGGHHGDGNGSSEVGTHGAGRAARPDPGGTVRRSRDRDGWWPGGRDWRNNCSILTPQVLEPIYGLSLLSLQHPQTGTTVILPADWIPGISTTWRARDSLTQLFPGWPVQPRFVDVGLF